MSPYETSARKTHENVRSICFSSNTIIASIYCFPTIPRYLYILSVASLYDEICFKWKINIIFTSSHFRICIFSLWHFDLNISFISLCLDEIVHANANAIPLLLMKNLEKARQKDFVRLCCRAGCLHYHTIPEYNRIRFLEPVNHADEAIKEEVGHRHDRSDHQPETARQEKFHIQSQCNVNASIIHRQLSWIVWVHKLLFPSLLITWLRRQRKIQGK